MFREVFPVIHVYYWCTVFFEKMQVFLPKKKSLWDETWKISHSKFFTWLIEKENEDPFSKRQFSVAQKGKYYFQKGSTEVHVTWEKGKIELSLQHSRDRTPHVHTSRQRINPGFHPGNPTNTEAATSIHHLHWIFRIPQHSILRTSWTSNQRLDAAIFWDRYN